MKTKTISIKDENEAWLQAHPEIRLSVLVQQMLDEKARS